MNENYYSKGAFLRLADIVVSDFRPATVLHIGCSSDFLAAVFRERGISAYSSTLNDNLPDSFLKRYDLVIIQGVLEQLQADERQAAVKNLCSYSDTILFIYDSITPPSEFWACIFAQNQFYNVINYRPNSFPWRVCLFQKRCNVINTIFEYEKFIRQNFKKNSENEIELENFKSFAAELQKKNEELQKEIQNYSNLLEHERARANEFSNAYFCLINSTTWKATKPVRFSLDILKVLIRLSLKTFRFLHSYVLHFPLKTIKNKIFHSHNENIQTLATFPSVSSSADHLHEHSQITGHPIDPIDIIAVDTNCLRLNLITDSLKSDSLLGGVATALIVATLYAEKMNCELRIITRNENVSPLNYVSIMHVNGITPAKKISFYSDYERFDRDIDFKLDVGPNDIFLATSWWSALAAEKTSIRNKFFYIIQEVETFFYNYGSEHLLCERVMKSSNIDFLINSSFLYNYFKENEPNITNNGVYFEPAFSKLLYKKPIFRKKQKYKLFFYARPNNPRNLYQIGVNMLKKAIETGILTSQEWEIYCVGQDVPVIEFSEGSKSINLGRLSWPEYADFLSDIDLALCLMYTPHPSYPPFDVACSGGVVLSNKMLNKVSFDMCKNVILADLDEALFLDSFQAAVSLAQDIEQRKQNFEENTIPRNWKSTLCETLRYMEEKSRNV